MTIKKNPDDYKTGFLLYLEIIKSLNLRETNSSNLRLEVQYESLIDWSQIHNFHFVKNWFLKKRKNPPIKVKNIPLNQCTNWLMKKGNYIHKSGEFFKVNALRISETRSREVDKWDQPVLTQIGYDGGILGLIRKRFFGVPHYLIEAKLEPGNYKFVQLSPTLQATFSNLRRAHRGRKPYFSQYFDLKKKITRKILYKQWLSEDGGRLNKKRNLGMILEIPEKTKLKMPKDFIWMSMWQIKECLKYNAWVNPHVRGLISCL